MMPYRLVSPITHRRIGRRGAFLLMLSLLQGLLGWTTLLAPPATIHALTLFQNMTPMELALTWLIPAAVGFVAAWLRPGLDGLGFFLGYGLFFFWGAAYLLSWLVFHDLPGNLVWRPVGFYWCLAMLVLVTAGWSENPSDCRKGMGDD